MNENNLVRAAPVGGTETVLRAMNARSEATQVQERGVFALLNLATNDDNRVKIASLGDFETVLHVMRAKPSATQVDRTRSDATLVPVPGGF